MIQSWKDKSARELFEGRTPKGFPAQIAKAARRRLGQLHGAVSLDDLRTPPGNRLHALEGDREGQWSVSVNDQYRICFQWGEQGPESVEIVDYH